MYVLQIRLPAVPKQRRKMTRFDVSICWSTWPLHEAKQKNPGQLSLIKPFVILFSEVNFWWPFSVGEWRRCRISTSGAISHCCSLYTVTRRWSAGWSYEGLNIHLIPFPEGNFCSCAACKNIWYHNIVHIGRRINFQWSVVKSAYRAQIGR